MLPISLISKLPARLTPEPRLVRRVFCCPFHCDRTFNNDQHCVLCHNPATVWPVPDEFRLIYSHAAEFPAEGRMLFISGQFGVRPDGTLADGFERQCEQAMDNVEALLTAAGMSRGNIVKLTYYLTRTADFPALGRIRRQRWAASAAAPSVTAIAVAGLARPEYLIEIEAVAAAQS